LSVVAFGLSDYIFDVQDKLIYEGALKPMMVAQNPYFAKAPSKSTFCGACLSLLTTADSRNDPCCKVSSLT
jgi:hypothetical protein